MASVARLPGASPRPATKGWLAPADRPQEGPAGRCAPAFRGADRAPHRRPFLEPCARTILGVMKDPDAPDFGFDLADASDERDLLVVLRLSNRNMGTQEERADIALLADALDAAVQEAGVGQYDGDEYGGGECVLFFSGPDEEGLLSVLRPSLHRSPAARGAHFVRLVEGPNGEQTRAQIRP